MTTEKMSAGEVLAVLDGLSTRADRDGMVMDVRELRLVRALIAELIAADVEYDAADRAFDYSALDTAEEIEAASSRYTAAIKRRAAALSACTGKDHES